MVHDSHHFAYNDEAGNPPDILPSRAQYYRNKEISPDGGVILPFRELDELRITMDERPLAEGCPEFDKRVLADGMIRRAYANGAARGDLGVDMSVAELHIINKLAWPLELELADDDHLATVTSLEFGVEPDAQTVLPRPPGYRALGQLGMS